MKQAYDLGVNFFDTAEGLVSSGIHFGRQVFANRNQLFSREIRDPNGQGH